MRYFLFLMTLILSTSVFAQEDKVYDVVSDPARLMVCELQPITLANKRKCSEQRLLRFVSQSITYPEAALADSIEGTVVVRFVVHQNGYMGQAEVLRDIGGGCGDVALAVLDSIRADSVLWRPGMRDSVAVNSYVTLPIRFRIPKVYDYELIDGDTLYTIVDEMADYEGGTMGFNMYAQTNLGYPSSGVDSCYVGDFGVQLKIDRSGKASILDLIDYNGLGIDFEFQAIRMINAMPSKWIPATRHGKKVPALYSGRVLFQPPTAACTDKITVFDQGVDLATKGDVLFAEGDLEGAIVQYANAIELIPNNAEWLYKRGVTHFELKQYAQGCPDLYAAKETLIYTSVDALLPLLCRDTQDTSANQ